ncbi:MAG: hypothetical protein AUJ75_01020 [Candidatus Omnitrophica bacterium CG1_02_49_10]|nr:MAG: hypothetical protein AUJ75_01020 [Candidatus Omnitrophica bacterium CG1_02_49_10]
MSVYGNQRSAILLSFFLALGIFTAGPFLSAQEDGPESEVGGSVSGTVQSVDPNTGILSILTQEGDSLSFKIDEDTVLWRGDDIIGAGDLVSGEEVDLQFYSVGEEKVVDWIDTRITEGPGSFTAGPEEEDPSPSEDGAEAKSMKGEIVTVNADEETLSVRAQDGTSYDLRVSDDDALVWLGDDIIEISDLKAGEMIEVDYYEGPEGILVASWIELARNDMNDTEEIEEEQPE